MGKDNYATGLFAVKGRVFPDIIKKQIETVNELDYHLEYSVRVKLFRITRG